MSTHVIIGKRLGWGGTETLCEISTADSRRHLYVIGKTGSGKTTLLHNLLVQRLEAG